MRERPGGTNAIVGHVIELGEEAFAACKLKGEMKRPADQRLLGEAKVFLSGLRPKYRREHNQYRPGNYSII